MDIIKSKKRIANYLIKGKKKREKEREV